MVTAEQTLRELIGNDRKFIETLFVVENKQREIIPFVYNDIQADVDSTETGMDIWVKPAQVGFSTERIAKRLKDTLTTPGTNTILVAYDDFITARLLGKVQFFYNHLAGLNIPGFPEIHHDSTYEKTFRFYVNGRIHSISSIYIASARSYVAGRAETIHHLLFDEMPFYPSRTMDDIISPALDRVPPEGTVDMYGTPNGQENDFYDAYQLAKEGKSVFTPHIYTWFMHKEYVIFLNDPRMKFIPETSKPEFKLSLRENEMVDNFGLTFDQIRWRRWKIKQKESLRRSGEMILKFQQEFAEDDVSCFIAIGNTYYEDTYIERLAKSCYPAPTINTDGLNIWYPPEPGRNYIVTIDPGQERITLSAIGVMCFDIDGEGNYKPRWCARDAGLYSPEVTYGKAIKASNYYNRAMITWEDNAHGLALTVLLNRRRPIYFRRDLVNKIPTTTPGWRTTPSNKPFMLQKVSGSLGDLTCHDIELVRQLRNFRRVANGVEIVGADDIHDSYAVGLMCLDPKPIKRGMIGRTGWRW